MKTNNYNNRLLGFSFSLALLFCIYFVSEKISMFVGTKVLGFSKSPISSVMVALIIGFILRNIFKLPKFLNAGIKFGSKNLLRYGIILLGLRLSLLQMQEIAFSVIPVIIICVTIGLSLPHVFNKALKLPSVLVTLISVGTAICGISAIAATSESLAAKEEHTVYAITTITIFGLLGMLLYPFLSYFLFQGESLLVGLFLGTAIHDTAQVTGAAFLYQDFFNDAIVVQVATIVKLIRNTLMVIVIPGITIINKKFSFTDEENNREKQRKGLIKLFPVFIIGFIVMVFLRTIGDHYFVGKSLSLARYDNNSWELTIQFVLKISSILVTMALAAVGLSTSLDVFKNLGFKPLLVGLITMLSVGISSFILIIFLF